MRNCSLQENWNQKKNRARNWESKKLKLRDFVLVWGNKLTDNSNDEAQASHGSKMELLKEWRGDDGGFAC